MQNNKITNLVLGSEGFIGKPFCAYLESLGERVICYDIKRNAQEDLRNATLPLLGIDRVYFLAWDVGGAKYLFKEKSLLGQIEWNTRILLNTMPQLGKSGIPFFFLSSQYAEEYGTPYGASKRLGEIWTRLFPNGHFARQWNAYGDMEHMDERSHVMGDFIVQALTTKKIRMISNGEEYRQFVHLTDSFKAYHHMLENHIQGGVYDISSGEWMKIIDLARMIGDLTGAKLEIGSKVSPDHRQFPHNEQVPGWKPTILLKDGIARLVDEYAQRLKAN